MSKLCRVIFTLLLVSGAASAATKNFLLSAKNTARMAIPVDNVTPRESLPLEQILPMDLQAGSSQSQFMGRVADKSISFWFNSSALKDSALLQAAKAAQETLRTEVATTATESDEIQHKFKMKLEAFQSRAKLEYEGWVNAALNYDLRASVTEVRMKNLDHKDLVLCHRAKENLATIGLAWSF